MNIFYYLAMIILFVGAAFLGELDTSEIEDKLIIVVWAVFYGGVLAYSARNEKST